MHETPKGARDKEILVFSSQLTSQSSADSLQELSLELLALPPFPFFHATFSISYIGIVV